MKEKKNKPEWTPDNAGDEYTTNVMPGVEGGHDGMPGTETVKQVKIAPKRAKLNTEDYANGVMNADRTILARTITLIESNSEKHIRKAQKVLKEIMPKTGKSVRIGITGSPGAGKSTFIESLGLSLCEQGHKVAVLAIDPSSARSKGSILGDKTRMELLSREANAFIRPSPSGGTLGGVARKTRETILVCEAAGFDVILIETVGVGQSETTVRSMVDFFLLVLLPGAGDELQGIKKGVVELADGIAVNKAEGDNKTRAELTKQSYQQALHYIMPATDGWNVEVYTCSAIEHTGVKEIWEGIMNYIDNTKESGVFEARRNSQLLEWVYSMVDENLKDRFYNNENVKKEKPAIENLVLSGELPPTAAVSKLMDLENIKK